MNSNIGFYHHYIIKDIAEVEKRAEKYLNLRLKYVTSKCKPFTVRLEDLKTQTKKYALLEEQQRRSLEEGNDLTTINRDITRLRTLNDFFQQNLDQLQQVVFRAEDQNQSLKQTITILRQQLKSLRRQTILPTIYSSVPTTMPQSCKLQSKPSKRDRGASRKLKVSLSKQTQNRTLDEGGLLRQTLNNKISRFNNVQYLFKQCLDRKKLGVNRMIGQLQSGLVKKKVIFLKTCNALGNTSTQTVSYQEFSQLGPDQLLTLIVSFPKAEARLAQYFDKKRTRVTQIVIQHSKLKW